MAVEALRESKTFLLTTYERYGTGVGTPVSVAFEGARCRPGACAGHARA